MTYTNPLITSSSVPFELSIITYLSNLTNIIHEFQIPDRVAGHIHEAT